MLKPCKAQTVSFLHKLHLVFISFLMAAVICSPGFAASNSAAETTDKTAATDISREDALDLALKSITLSQGEKGIEVWRLKAEWANLIKQDNLIQVDAPRLTYFLEDGKVMYVESDKGDVEQKKQILRFIDHVRVTLDDRLLIGPLLIYNGADKSMTMPRGGMFTDPDLEGSAQHFVWHINTKIIEAEGDVHFHFSRPGKAIGNVPAPLEQTPESAQPADERPQTRQQE